MKISDKLKKVKLSEIKPYPNNPKQHDKEQIELVKNSLITNDYVQPIIIGTGNKIISGHCRYYALCQIDPKKESEIEVVDLSHKLKELQDQFRILDNRSSELSPWDFSKLEIELRGLYKNLESELEELNHIGISEAFLNEILDENAKLQKEEITDEMPDTDIQGEVENKNEYLILEFKDKKKLKRLKEKLDLRDKIRVVKVEMLEKALKIKI